MLLLAHIGVVPVEELLAPLASGGVGAGVLLTVASVLSRLRRKL